MCIRDRYIPYPMSVKGRGRMKISDFPE